MARPHRQLTEAHWYHVMNRGSRKWTTFLDNTDRRRFLWLLGEITGRFNIEVHAYCLMDNHYHLIVRCPDANLSEAMQYLSGRYTQRFNHAHGFDGPLFRGRFRSKPIGDDAYLKTAVRYVERNPFDATDDRDIAAYAWSSHGAYLRPGHGPKWLVKEAVLALFDNRLDRYGSFVQAAHVDDARHDLDPAVKDATVDVRPVEQAVLQATIAHPSDLIRSARSIRNDARLLLVLLLTETTQLPTSEIARRYEFATEASVRSALHRARQFATTDPNFAQLLGEAHREIAKHRTAA